MNDYLFEFLIEHLESPIEHGMQRVVKIEAAAHFISRGQKHIVSDGGAHLVVHRASGLVSDPAMDTSAAGEDPEHGLEAEVVRERVVEDQRRAGHVGPALAADFGARATGSHVVIVRHIDIEDHLFLRRNENFLLRRQMVLGRDVKDGSDIYLVRRPRYQGLLEFLRRLEA